MTYSSSVQVLDGYVYLGNTATLKEEVMNAFASVVSTACHKVIRGVILTRQGLEGKARSTSMMQELVKLLPPDLFRTCLARVSCEAHATKLAVSGLDQHPILANGKYGLTVRYMQLSGLSRRRSSRSSTDANMVCSKPAQ